MIKIDNYYRVIGATFGAAYFIGLIIALIYTLTGHIFVGELNFINNLSLTSTTFFKSVFYTTMQNALQMAVIPFSYLIVAVKYGFAHIVLLTSSFLGQIKLIVQLIPQIFFFITFIIFSTIGIKLILAIIKEFINDFLIKGNKDIRLKIRFLRKEDIIMFYIGLISLVIGTIIQTHLIRILFIFLINLRSFTYILIIVLYMFLIALLGFTTYKAIKELLLTFNKQKR